MELTAPIIKHWREEGRVEGRANLLLRLLFKKFGDLSDKVKNKVLNADPKDLDRWADNILFKDRLDDVLD